MPLKTPARSNRLHARGRVLAFVNPDLFVHPGRLRPLLERLDAGASLVAPTLVDETGRVSEAGVRLYADGSTAPIVDDHPAAGAERRPADFASAACWLIGRDEHERVGGFDPGYHPAYYEDADYALRLAALGGRLEIADDVTVEHRHGMGTLEGRRFIDTARQRDLLLARHPEIAWTRPARR